MALTSWYWLSGQAIPSNIKSKSSSPVFKTYLAKVFLQFFQCELRGFLLGSALAVIFKANVRLIVYKNLHHIQLVGALPLFAQQLVLQHKFIFLAEDLQLAFIIVVCFYQVLNIKMDLYNA